MDDLTVWFEPAYGGNREKPEESRILVRLRPLTAKEYRKYQLPVLKQSKGGIDLDRFAQMQDKIVTDCVVEIENYESVNGRPVKNGSDLVDYGTQGLLDEVFNAIHEQSTLEEGLAKKFDSSPDCIGAGIETRGDGVVPSVAGDLSPNQIGNATLETVAARGRS